MVSIKKLIKQYLYDYGYAGLTAPGCPGCSRRQFDKFKHKDLITCGFSIKCTPSKARNYCSKCNAYPGDQNFNYSNNDFCIGSVKNSCWKI